MQATIDITKYTKQASAQTEWIRIFDVLLSKVGLSGNYFISREALDMLTDDGEALIEALEWFNGPCESIQTGQTVQISDTMQAYFGFDGSLPNSSAFFVRIDLVRIDPAKCAPHELTLQQFAGTVQMMKLDAHPRKWQAKFGEHSLGFADATARDDAIREVHERQVNNALYANTIDAPVAMRRSMPPAVVLAQYPELAERFRNSLREPI